MQSINRLAVLAGVLACAAITMVARPVKIHITGTIKENVTMRVGGNTYTITTTPFVFYIEKKELPQRATFESPNYTYEDISVNWDDPDPYARGYFVLKSESKLTATANRSVESATESSSNAAHTLDMSIDVNKAPMTKRKSENTFAVIIANENYTMAKNVDMSGNDGLAFKMYCENTLGLGTNNIKYYPDATFGMMNKALNEVKDIAKAFDGDINLIFYYAGHGIPDNATKDAFLMPVDADGTDPSVCVSLKKVYKTIDDMKLNQAVVFLDACFSGARRDGDMIVAARGVAIKAKEEKPTGNTIVFTATSDEEAAFSYKEKKHGMFSYFLLNKLQETKGEATLGELADYITKQVKRQSVVVNGKSQTPNVIVPPTMTDSWNKLTLTGKK